jgi:hypothetical protein
MLSHTPAQSYLLRLHPVGRAEQRREAGPSSGKGQPRVFGSGPEQAEAPPDFGLPGYAADQRSPSSRFGERQQVVGKRPLTREPLGLALCVDRPCDSPVVREVQADGRVAVRARRPVAQRVTRLTWATFAVGAGEAGCVSASVPGLENCLTSCAESVSLGARATTSLSWPRRRRCVPGSGSSRPGRNRRPSRTGWLRRTLPACGVAMGQRTDPTEAGEDSAGGAVA